MKIPIRVDTLFRLILIVWFMVAVYAHHNVGLADNGDYARSMKWITLGPPDIESTWPGVGTEDRPLRFFKYWIPYWELEWKISRITSSAILLWLPGALLNMLFYSKNVLYLPFLSLIPKLILLSVLLLLFNWILNTKHKTLLLFTLGLPVTLMLTTTDYLAYLNSFYQESASLIYLFLLFISLLRLGQRPSVFYLVLSLTCILLLATAKPANLYWPLLAVPFVIYLWPSQKSVNKRTKVLLALVLMLVFTLISAINSTRSSILANPYHSLFNGALSFTADPSSHLQKMGMERAARCINTSAFSVEGTRCFNKYQDRMSYLNTLLVISREPAVLLRMLRYTFESMQDVSLDYLGKYAYDDPLSRGWPQVSSGANERFWLSESETRFLNLWALIKYNIFPTGYVLLVFLAGFIVWFLWDVKRKGEYWDLSLVGLLFTIACVVDSTVAILGDGKNELIKHLFLANVLFDLALLVFLNSVLIYFLDRKGKKRLKEYSPETSQA